MYDREDQTGQPAAIVVATSSNHSIYTQCINVICSTLSRYNVHAKAAKLVLFQEMTASTLNTCP